MPPLKLGVVLESLNRPLRQAIDLAATLGVAGVQVDAVGDSAPEGLSQTGRREFRHLLRSRGLELTALGCPLRRGFDVHEHSERRVAHVRNVMSLAYDLGSRVVIAFAGVISEDENDPSRQLLLDNLTALGRHGERIGATLALETGLDAPAKLAALLSRLPYGGLGVNIDPASLLMRGFDPAGAVRELGQWIAHTHARDARPDRPDRGAQEVPLGHGDIDWTAYLGALEEVEYRGWITLKRGPASDPVADIKTGLAFLRGLGG